MNNKEFLDVQKTFSELLGLPGYEDEVSSFILEKISPFVDKAWKDPLGNILAIKKGTDKDAGQKILLELLIGYRVLHNPKQRPIILYLSLEQYNIPYHLCFQ